MRDGRENMRLVEAPVTLNEHAYELLRLEILTFRLRPVKKPPSVCWRSVTDSGWPQCARRFRASCRRVSSRSPSIAARSSRRSRCAGCETFTRCGICSSPRPRSWRQSGGWTPRTSRGSIVCGRRASRLRWTDENEALTQRAARQSRFQLGDRRVHRQCAARPHHQLIYRTCRYASCFWERPRGRLRNSGAQAPPRFGRPSSHATVNWLGSCTAPIWPRESAGRCASSWRCPRSRTSTSRN